MSALNFASAPQLPGLCQAISAMPAEQAVEHIDADGAVGSQDRGGNLSHFPS